MRIICLVTNDLSHDQRMDRICTALVADGHSVTLIGRLLPDSPDLPPRPYRQHRITCRYKSGKLFYAEYNYRLIRELRHFVFDAVCAVDLDTLLAGYRLAGGRKKLVFDAHEWFTETPEVVGRPLVRGIWRGLGKALIPRTDARYTVGPRLAERLAKTYGVPFATVRNAPLRVPERKLLFAKDLSKTDRRVILYQGMFNPGRGLETAIAAMHDLPDCELWLVGNGPLLGALRGCSGGLESEGRVRFLGFRAPDELPAITRRAWLGLNLLDASSPSYYYSLANKSLDYLQAGLPSVQMDFPEYRAIADTYGCYAVLPALDAAALTACIQALIDDDIRYEKLVAGCRTAAKTLCWERERAGLLAIWRELANTR